jgi:hypothetical protein
MSPLEKAIADIPKTGWLMNGLGKSPLDSPQPWSVDLVPSYFGIYQWGEPDKSGPYTRLPNGAGTDHRQRRDGACGHSGRARETRQV